MSKFRNDTGSVLTVNDLGRQVGPLEEFDWPGHDVKVHGLVPGCTWLDAPQADASADDEGDTIDGQPEDTAAAPDSGEAPRTFRNRKGAGDEGKETA